MDGEALQVVQAVDSKTVHMEQAVDSTAVQAVQAVDGNRMLLLCSNPTAGSHSYAQQRVAASLHLAQLDGV